MPKTTRQIIAAALLLGSAGVLVQPAVAADKKADAAKAGPKLTKAVQVALLEAQKLDQAGDFAGALAQVRVAEAVPGLTPVDSYTIAQLKLNIAIGLRKAEPPTSPSSTPQPLSPGNALLEEALNGMLAGPDVPQAEKVKYLGNLGILALQRGDYNTATKRNEELLALAPNDTEVLINLSVLYQRQKQPAKAIEIINRAIAARKAAGQPAEQELYRRALALAYDAKLADQIDATSVALVTAYPNPVNWRDALIILRDRSKLDDQGNLDVLRLMSAAGALNGERDFAEYAETAATKGLPGEAKAALADGKAKGALTATKPFVAELSKLVDSKVAGDRAALPGLDREARNAANGKAALGTADAYYGYGDYAKAADLYKVAIAKGGVDSDTANLRLGASMARGGDKAGAAAALANVKTGARGQLAQYWLIWLNAKA